MHEEEVVGIKGSTVLSLCNKKVGFELIVWFQSHILAFPGCGGGVISGTELGSHIPEVLLQMGGSKVCREEVQGGSAGRKCWRLQASQEVGCWRKIVVLVHILVIVRLYEVIRVSCPCP